MSNFHRFIATFALLFSIQFSPAQVRSKLMQLPESLVEIADVDWLITHPEQKAVVSRKGDQDLIISNGLISRTFRVIPSAATISLKNLVTSEEYIRAVSPEAEVVIDGLNYPVGGLSGQPEKAYLLEGWLDQMVPPENAFVLKDFEVRDMQPSIQWTSERWMPTTRWEQEGLEIVFYYEHGDQAGAISIEIHYGMYNELPLLCKWMVIRNTGEKNIRIDHFTSEIIAHPEKNNYVDEPERWDPLNLYMENDYAFGGFTYAESNRAVFEEYDSSYTSQVNWERKTPVILKSMPGKGPAYTLSPGMQFESFRTYLLALDGTDRERNSLSKRKMYRAIAPWVSENPIFMHLTTTDPSLVKEAIDQCEAVGYEMVILSFGSGLDMEDLSKQNLDKFRSLVDYAHQRGIELGGYSLFSSRRINDSTDVIDPLTGKPGGAKFGHAPCAVSEWGINYTESLKQFIKKTGFDILEHDGPYPGDFCASVSHPGHEAYLDSQWKQWRATTDFYKWLRSAGVYINAPDCYQLSGTNKVGIGYREVNWSLPRAQQIILGRQNIYDGTWLRTPSMGWTFVPLTEYHGGGAEATLEPLSEHLDDYDAHMLQNYGSGVQACYRGPRLFDTDKTKALVAGHIRFYKKYRDILNADIIHLRRPDGRDWDGMLHVDPFLETKGVAILYNPTDMSITREIVLPLYYTGLSDGAMVALDEETYEWHKLNRDYEISLLLTIPAHGHRKVFIRAPD